MLNKMKSENLDKNEIKYEVKFKEDLYESLKSLALKYENVEFFNKTITEFTNGTATIPIESEDTINMDSGTYIYDIVVNRSDGTVDTLTPNGQAYFTLKKGVR